MHGAQSPYLAGFASLRIMRTRVLGGGNTSKSGVGEDPAADWSLPYKGRSQGGAGDLAPSMTLRR